jgi:hypothetical protein
MKKNAAFTQKAFLKTAALFNDSEICEDAELAYVRSRDFPERYANAIVRCLLPPQDFGKLTARLNSVYFEHKINFNWHLWPSSHSKLLDFATGELGMVRIGAGEALFKDLSSSTEPTTQSSSVSPLLPEDVEEYITAKMIGWGNDHHFRELIKSTTLKLVSDVRHKTLLLREELQIVGAVSSFAEGKHAYLRGDFVIPTCRGRGVYRQLIRAREAALFNEGIKTLTTLADEDTSAPIFRKLGYRGMGKVHVLAVKPSLWVSL